MPSTRVLLYNLPPLLEDMLSSVLGTRSDLEIIRGGDADSTIIDAAVAAGARVIVVARSDPSDLASIDAYLARASNVSVVAIAVDGEQACTHAFRPTWKLIEDVSAEQILTAITTAAAETGDHSHARPG